MKKLKMLVVLMMVATLITGCGMKMNFDLTVKANKDVVFGAIMAMDDELIDTILSMDSDDEGEKKTITDKERWAYLEENFKSNDDVDYEKYTEGKFKGYKMSETLGQINLVTKDTASTRVNIANFFEDESSDIPTLFTRDGEYYVSNMKFDTTGSDSFSGMEEYQSSMDLFEMKFIITLPTKPVSNNADSVSNDGKTLTWNLKTESKDIEFKFDFKDAKDPENNNNQNNNSNNNNNGSNNNSNGKENNSVIDKKDDDKKTDYLPWIIGGCSVLVVVGGIVIFALNKKKKQI